MTFTTVNSIILVTVQEISFDCYLTPLQTTPFTCDSGNGCVALDTIQVQATDMSSPIVAQENGLGPSAYSQAAAVCSMPGANQAGSIIWVCSTRKVTKPLTRPA